MHLSTSNFAFLALVLASQALGCVQFNGTFAGAVALAATLIDNNDTVCTYSNNININTTHSVLMNCTTGYTANFSWYLGSIQYTTPVFQGNFTTDLVQTKKAGGPDISYYTADVWGC